MKIAVIVQKFPTVSETFILNHITGLLDQGHDVSIIAFQKLTNSIKHPIFEEYALLKRTIYIRKRPKSKIAARLFTAFLTLCYFAKSPRTVVRAISYLMSKKRSKFYQCLFFLFTFLRIGSCDVYHFHFGNIGRYGAFLKVVGLPLTMITSFHGYDINKLPLQKPKEYYDELFEYGDHFIANTNFTKQQVMKLGCDPARMSVVPVGLHVRDFPFNPKTLAGGEIPKLLTVGRLVEKKGHIYSIKAVGKLIHEGTKLHYTIAGDGPLRKELEGLVNDLNISDHVTFTGELTQTQVIELYSNCHLFVLTSVTAGDGDKEGQGLVLQEAQACGLPVISTLHNGIPDGVLDGKSGILVPEKDTEALSKAIKNLLETPLCWPEMGKQGRLFVEKTYDTKLITNRLIEIYNTIKV